MCVCVCVCVSVCVCIYACVCSMRVCNVFFLITQREEGMYVYVFLMFVCSCYMCAPSQRFTDICGGMQTSSLQEVFIML